MAKAGATPLLATPADAIAALDRDLPKALKGRSLEQAGWRRINGMTLVVPLQGRRADGTLDDYLLRLGFACYPDWPPSAQFVNPQTLNYDIARDKCWLPQIDNCAEIHIHPNYQNKDGQLICCSLTLEFYNVLHAVKEEHVWSPKKHNLSATINQIDWALKSQFYKGRQHALSPG